MPQDQDSFDVLGSLFSILFASNDPNSGRYAPQVLLEPISEVATYLPQLGWQLTGKSIQGAWGSLVRSASLKERAVDVGNILFGKPEIPTGRPLTPEEQVEVRISNFLYRLVGRRGSISKLTFRKKKRRRSGVEEELEGKAVEFKGVAEGGMRVGVTGLGNLLFKPGAFVDSYFGDLKKKRKLLKDFRRIVAAGKGTQAAGVFAVALAAGARKDMAVFLAQVAGTQRDKWVGKGEKMVYKGVSLFLEGHLRAQLQAAGVPASEVDKVIKALVKDRTLERNMVDIIKNGLQNGLSNDQIKQRLASYLQARFIQTAGSRLQRARVRNVNTIEGIVRNTFNSVTQQGAPNNLDEVIEKGLEGIEKKNFGELAEKALAPWQTLPGTRGISKLVHIARNTKENYGWGEKAGWWYLRWKDYQGRGGLFSPVGILTGDFFLFVSGATAFWTYKKKYRVGGREISAAPELDWEAIRRRGGVYQRFVDSYFARTATGEYAKKFVGPGMGLFTSPNATLLPFRGPTLLDIRANKFQRGAWWMYRLHPFQLVKGVLDGGLFFDLWAYGSKWGQLDYASLPRYAQISMRILNNKYYQAWLKGVAWLKYMKDLPTMAVEAGLVGAKQLALKGISKFVVKTGLGRLLSKLIRKITALASRFMIDTALSALSGGLYAAYKFLTKIPIIGGMLEKFVDTIVKELVKLGVILILGFILAIFLTIVQIGMIFSYVPRLIGDAFGKVKKWIKRKVFRADPHYSIPDASHLPPFVDVDMPQTNLQTIQPANASDVPGMVAVCPVGGGYITQGPYGSYSHALCKKGRWVSINFAVDVGLGAGQPIYAPVSGKIIACQPYYPGGTYIGDRMILHSDTGYDFIFLHLKCAVSAGAKVNQGDVIGVIAGEADGVVRSNYWDGPHLHFVLYNWKKGKFANGAEWFRQVCPFVSPKAGVENQFNPSKCP